ncbi:MAG: hypothetical protein MUC65_08610 [Pontiellaceae bacterium]|nr:hypothetical protein [Pontiellaceae bacterium]
MKRIILSLMAGMVAGAVVAQDEVMVQDQASENEVTLQADVSLLSAYVWRGLVANNGMVAQPSMTAAKGSLSFNVWGNYDIEGRAGNNDYDWTEYNFKLAYRLPEGLIMEKVDLDVGIIKYEYAGDWSGKDNTEEIFSVLTLGNIILTPVISAYYDINEANGWYGNFALSQGVEISDAFSAEIGSSIGYGTRNYNKFYFTEDNGSGAANDYNAYISAEYDLTEQITLGALLQYTYLDGGVANDIEQTDNLLWGGITASYKF